MPGWQVGLPGREKSGTAGHKRAADTPAPQPHRRPLQAGRPQASRHSHTRRLSFLPCKRSQLVGLTPCTCCNSYIRYQSHSQIRQGAIIVWNNTQNRGRSYSHHGSGGLVEDPRSRPETVGQCGVRPKLHAASAPGRNQEGFGWPRRRLRCLHSWPLDICL